MGEQIALGLLTKRDILKHIDDENIVISPLLDQNQIGEITVDLRVGIDFLTLQQGREAFIDSTEDLISERPIKSHYTSTRRKLGEPFLLHPSQPVLFSTLEYLKLPNDIYVDLVLRSSYNRLGLTISTIVQPGYCGCVSVEIVNTGKMPIKILAGARILQARFYKINQNTNYFNSKRKYNCQVRPVASKANEDLDLKILKKLYR